MERERVQTYLLCFLKKEEDRGREEEREEVENKRREGH
jgi:hypothetical protein